MDARQNDVTGTRTVLVLRVLAVPATVATVVAGIRVTGGLLARGGRALTRTSFDVDNGPDLRVHLVAGPATTEDEVDDFEDIGGLEGNKGNQQYEIPDGVDLARYSTVVIWCRAFSVLFARAPLEGGKS